MSIANREGTARGTGRVQSRERKQETEPDRGRAESERKGSQREEKGKGAKRRGARA